MDMGRHSPPLDGVVANGHAPTLVPFAIPSQIEMRQSGPVTPWPQAAASGDGRWRHARRVMSAHRAWLAAVPVILVNAVAFGAQLGFWRAHVPLVTGAVVVALALESIAIYLAWQAHLAQLADDAALRLRLSAYGMALIIGALNYSHFDGPHWRPTVPAVTFGMMSAISPWLWSVHSRRQSRDALKAKGLIEPHAVRLGATRWQWHPVRSFSVMSRATWTGETDPAAAIAAWKPRTARRLPDALPDASEAPSPDAGTSAPPDAAEDRQEAVTVPPRQPSPDAPEDVRPKARKAAPRPSARTRALAIMKAHPDLADPEVMKRAKTSKSTVERARKELNGARP